GPAGLDIAKALEAGYGTDSSVLDGGAALRKQSMSRKPANYFDFRNQIAKAMRLGECGPKPVSADLVRHAQEKFGMAPDESSEHVERFLNDIKTSLSPRRAA
ncbi:MAG TPA: hypothetical protein DEQ40_08155, partial [Oxalobacteraceae bacterium]|nr:hypothetical protein [Oxalobacteraceae bacterium]